MGVKGRLNRPEFRRLIVGQTVSSLGDWMGTLALMYFVLALSGSTTAVGGVLVLRLLPSALGAPVAARVVTRWRRRSVMLTSDLVRVGMAVVLPVVPSLWWVYFWAFMIEVVGLMFLPARDAAIPFLIGEGREEGKDDHDTGTLELANGITMATSYGMIPFGAGMFGLILWVSERAGWGGHWRYVVVFWLDALTYLASWLAVRAIPDLGPGPGEKAAMERDEREAREEHGFVNALKLRVVRSVLPGIAVVALGLGALFSLGVVFVKGVINAGQVGFGVLVVCFGIGAIIGLLLLHRKTGSLLTQVRAATAVQGVVIASMGGLASEPWSFVGAVLFGAAATSALVGGITYLQESLGGVDRNLALTAFHSVLRFGLALAALLAGAAADLLKEAGERPLGMVPAQFVLMLSGLVVLAGTFLIKSPEEAAPT
ncbi:MFS transporter [Actinomadura verrucosospora]|uniref:Thymidylate kinase n=1 Tax=Actinomadura verrucosospora TaxID=46165 RepID=A0A7D4ALZ4_ACTVE|nr:MFS transporter [Actinomadura verrucosospora]QKG21748.1 thymidylate kinase [Actinomadura verrucosospora]